MSPESRATTRPPSRLASIALRSLQALCLVPQAAVPNLRVTHGAKQLASDLPRNELFVNQEESRTTIPVRASAASYEKKPMQAK